MKSVLIVLPTLNEEIVIRENTLALLRFCDQELSGYDWKVLVADNGSSDRTIQEVLGITHPRFLFFHSDQRGRGHALVRAWSDYPADYLVYMDCDLSVNLRDLLPLLDALEHGADLVTGSRFVPGARVARSVKRETSSRVYIFLVKWLLEYPGSDTQCGFKGLRREVFEHLKPLLDPKHQTSNSGWFFDTELFVLAHRRGFRVQDIPVEWVEKRNVKRKSRVNLVTITWNYLRQIWGLRRKIQK